MATKKQKGKAVSLTYYIATERNGDVCLCCHPPGYKPGGGKYLIGDVERGVGWKEVTFDELRERYPITAMKANPYAFPVEEVAKQFPAIAEEWRKRAAQFRQEQDAKGDVATCNAGMPTIHYDAVSRLANAFFLPDGTVFVSGEETPIPVKELPDGDRVCVIVVATIIGDTRTVKLRVGKYDEYDRAVYMAVIDIMKEYRAKGGTGKVIFDSISLDRAIKHRADSNPTQAEITEMNESIRTLGMIDVAIDASQEFKLKDDWNVCTGIFPHKRFLDVEVIELQRGQEGACIFVYRLREVPPVWEYTEITRRRVCVKAELLSAEKGSDGQPQGKRPRLDRKTIAMNHYLIRNTQEIKNAHRYGDKRSRLLTYERMFAALDGESKPETESDKRQRRRDNAKMFELLDRLQEKGQIPGYEPVTDKGRKDKHGDPIKPKGGRPAGYGVRILTKKEATERTKAKRQDESEGDS